MTAPTLRTLAEALGLSRTTVSDALRGLARVSPRTIVRVRQAAAAAGYERNPLTGSVMSLLRRSRAQQCHGALAALELVDPSRSLHAAQYNAHVLTGVRQRAQELGFTVEHLRIGPQHLRLRRVDAILHTRGIQALVILPASGFPDLTGLHWSRYTAVYADYYIDQPALHCVCSDHYRSMVLLLQELHARGYRRPGLFMEILLDERLHHRWEGAFLALQRYLPETLRVPALRLKEVNAAEFQAWFRKHEPDVVLGHHPAAVEWMRDCGAAIPDRHAFVCLNSLRSGAGCAALDLRAGLVGARAAELVVGQLLHNEFGAPEHPSLTTMPAVLREGATLRPASDPLVPAAIDRRRAVQETLRRAGRTRVRPSAAADTTAVSGASPIAARPSPQPAAGSAPPRHRLDAVATPRGTARSPRQSDR